MNTKEKNNLMKLFNRKEKLKQKVNKIPTIKNILDFEEISFQYETYINLMNEKYN